jgi:pimeloyl-ACP methyl ester carboxylesterase
MSSEAPSRSGQLAEGIRQCELVLRELGWERFEILAVSGGTPLGLSVAGALGERVVRTTVACGLGPVGEREFFGQLSPTSRAALRLLPFLPRRALGAALPAWVLRFLFPASAADKEVLADAGVWLALMQAKTEAWAQGGAGPLADAACFLSDWGRRLGKIPGGVRFFHGQEDRVIAPEMSRLLARRLESDCVILPGEGHFSLPVRQVSRMLAL